MTNQLIETIISEDDTFRNRSINVLLKGKNKDTLLRLVEEVEAFRISSNNLYHKVRSSLFLFVLYRLYLSTHEDSPPHGEIPFEGVRAAFDRNFEKSVHIYLTEIKENGNHNGSIFSALADSYYRLSFKYLLDQVKLSLSHCSENFLLFNINGLDDYPYSVATELTTPDPKTGLYPLGLETSPVRLDPSHSGWSDIFFLGMDFPEGARVVNISINLRIHGSNGPILPPCECYCRFIEEPVIHLTSVDLHTSKKIATLQELFNFGNDHLSLLKAGVVASGIVPPCFEKKDIRLKDTLHKLLNKPGGLEVVTRVNGIPKGSRLAVSTMLLATIITSLMRFSSQIRNQTGSINEEERRIVASRAILGEWLGGSGGGWQDSGGLWPGTKVITGKFAETGDPEMGVSRGCLLPQHNVLSKDEMPKEVQDQIINSMVLVHGGISQDVGPILEMVTEKYLLRYENEWEARLRGINLFDRIVYALKVGDMKGLGKLTTQDWQESLQQIIPWVNNAFTENLISIVEKEFKDDYWGFLMLGGMSGGGMAFIVNPEIRELFKTRITSIMHKLKEIYNFSFPFIIEPVVYDFEFNHEGIVAHLLTGPDANLPDIHPLCRKKGAIHGESNEAVEEDKIKKKYGLDSISHEHMKTLLKSGEIGLLKNRLPLTTCIRNVRDDEISHFENEAADSKFCRLGIDALRKNEVAVVSFAGGLGSRWTLGAAVVKPIIPFVAMDGKYRTFIEIHLAKSRKTSMVSGHRIAHVFTTSYLTHDAIDNYLKRHNCFDYEGQIYLSSGKTIGHRVYPMERDLRFFWEEQLEQKLDENAQKIQDDLRRALIGWTKSRGEGEDYRENRPILRFNPPGHWYEIPNLIKNGVLAKMLRDNPDLKYLFCHNIDTMGAYIDPCLLGMHIASHSCLTFEVIPRRIEDHGGWLANINGHNRLIEGLALPREEDEYKLTYYNSLTNWIAIDSLLEFFKLDRERLLEAFDRAEYSVKIVESIRRVEKRIPTYVTIKNVKYLWGSGQEDVYPVAQFEKAWGDMTSLKDMKVRYVAVSRFRGQQLKEPSQLHLYMTGGSFDYLKNKVCF